MRKRKTKKLNYLKFVFILAVLFIFGWIGKKTWFLWVSKTQLLWNGKSAYSLALETSEKDILILSLIPAKKLATVIEVPGETQIETPWFGQYLAEKLALLSEQEKSRAVFRRSLSYSLGIPIDSERIGTNLIKTEKTWSQLIPGYFRPWWGVEDWRLWLFLKQRDLVWQEYNIADWSEKKKFPDGRDFYDLNEDLFWAEIRGAFTDSIVRREELSVSVFNIGKKQDLAGQTTNIIQQMGIRVVEIGDRDRELEAGCLIVTAEENELSFTVHRLRKIFDCEFLLEEPDGLADIQFFIRSVKI